MIRIRRVPNPGLPSMHPPEAGGKYYCNYYGPRYSYHMQRDGCLNRAWERLPAYWDTLAEVLQLCTRYPQPISITEEDLQ